MSYSITNLKQEIEAIAHGTTIDKINNFDGMVYRAARQVLLDIDAQEAKRVVPISNAVYSQVYLYPVPDDLKGNKIIDIFPQANRLTTDLVTQTYNQNFSLYKGTNSTSNFSILLNSGVKTLELNDVNLPPPIILDYADIITGWSTTGSASNLRTDNVNYVSGSGAVTFDLSAGQSSGGVEKTLLNPINLSNQINQSSIFNWVYLPTASEFTSVDVIWGTDSSNYYTRNLTVTQYNTALINGWNLLQSQWLGATVVGTPDSSAISYLAVNFNYDGTEQTAVKIDNIASTLGQILNIEYYSKFMFKDAITGAWQETITDDSNIINLDTESYNLLLYQVCIQMAQQVQGLDAMFYDGSFFENKYQEARMRYLMMYKTEVQKPSLTYYATTQPGYTKYVGRRWNY